MARTDCNNRILIQRRSLRVIAEELTASYDDLGLRQDRDAFDTLFDHAPDKLQVRNLGHHLDISALDDHG